MGRSAAGFHRETPGRRLVDLEESEKGLLGDVHPPDLLHPLLAFLLLLEKLALARDVSAVALGQDVLAHGCDVLAGDDPAADSGLDGHLGGSRSAPPAPSPRPPRSRSRSASPARAR